MPRHSSLSREELSSDLNFHLHRSLLLNHPIALPVSIPSRVLRSVLLHPVDECGRTLLHAAASGKGGHRAVEELLALGAPVDVRDRESGWTPLHVAAWEGRLRDFVHILKAGGNLWVKDSDSKTAVDLLRMRYAKRSTSRNGFSVPGVGQFWAWGSDAAGQLGFELSGKELEVGARRIRVGGCGVEDGDYNVVGAKGRCGGFSAVATGRLHSVLVGADGAVWVCGAGVSGVGPVRVQLNGAKGRVVSAAASDRRGAVVMEGGDVFLWVASEGEESLEGVSRAENVAQGRMRGVQLAGFSLADSYWIAVDVAGGLWGCGVNVGGVLGVDEEVEGEWDSPRKISQDSAVGKVVKVAVQKGPNGSSKRGPLAAALTRDGRVYVWGGNVGFRARRVVINSSLDNYQRSRNGSAVVQNSLGSKAVDISVGKGFLVVVTALGKVCLCSEFAGRNALVARSLTGRGRDFTHVSACDTRVVLVDVEGDAWETRLRPFGKNAKYDLRSLRRVRGFRGVVDVDVWTTHAVCVVEPALPREGCVDAEESSVGSIPVLDSTLTRGMSLNGVDVAPRLTRSEDREDVLVPSRSVFEPGRLYSLCERIIMKTLSLSSAFDVLRFAVDRYAQEVLDAVLEFLRVNFDRVLLGRGGVEKLIALEDEHVLALESHLHGAEAGQSDKQARVKPEALLMTVPGQDTRTASCLDRSRESEVSNSFEPEAMSEAVALKRLRVCRRMIGKLDRLTEDDPIIVEGCASIRVVSTERHRLELEAATLKLYVAEHQTSRPLAQSLACPAESAKDVRQQYAAQLPSMRKEKKTLGAPLPSGGSSPCHSPKSESNVEPCCGGSRSKSSIPAEFGGDKDHQYLQDTQLKKQFSHPGSEIAANVSLACVSSSSRNAGGDDVALDDTRDEAKVEWKPAVTGDLPSDPPAASPYRGGAENGSECLFESVVSEPSIERCKRETSSLTPKRRIRSKAKPVMSFGALQGSISCSSSVSPTGAPCSKGSSVSSESPSSPGVYPATVGAWGVAIPPKQALTLKRSREKTSPSFLDIQNEEVRQGKSQTPRVFFSSASEGDHSPPYMSSSTHASGAGFVPGKLEVRDFLEPLLAHEVSRPDEGKPHKSDVIAGALTTYGSSGAWNPSRQLKSETPSFLAIQKEEAAEKQQQARAPALGSLPFPARCAWMPLPGNSTPRQESFRRIEEEELANSSRRNLRNS